MLKQIFYKECVQGYDEDEWIDSLHLSKVEISSEQPAFPIEHALTGQEEGGWIARDAGEQTIRLTFDSPHNLRRIRLLFREEARNRRQEFVLSWAPEEGGKQREIVRQQYCFAPPSTVEEDEVYDVELEGVKTLQLTITPDQSDSTAVASLARWQIA